jgi:hypothetical protein
MRFLTGLLGALLLLPAAHASVVAVGPGAFPGGSPLLNFNGLPNGLEVNGLVVNGMMFTYAIGGVPTNGAVIIDGGPGTTNNITPPNIVSVGNDTGILGVVLPTTATLFGYGFAILSTGTVANATTISLFMGSTPVGSLSYPGVPNPGFTGGFAGIESTIPFNRAELVFNSAVAPAFAVDNVRYSPAVPEPATAPLVLAAFALACVTRNRRPFRS